MCEFSILPENTWNMDEKGAILGVGQRSKVIFHKHVGGKELVEGE